MNLEEAIHIILLQEGLSELPMAGSVSPSRFSILEKAWELVKENGGPERIGDSQSRLEVSS